MKRETKQMQQLQTNKRDGISPEEKPVGQFGGGTPTGYPSIDKPWLKYFSEEALHIPLPECSVYDYMVQNNREAPERIALDYFGRKISYGELIEQIDRTADAFYALGIREGDVVVGITPSFPEAIYSFYALNKIGAVSDWFDPRTGTDIILKEIQETSAKAVILMDGFSKLFQGRNLGVKNVILVSAKDSLPMPAKLLASLKKQPKYDNLHYTWKSFMALAKGAEAKLPVGNVAHSPALMEHTGGTTGQPKAVVLTNQNVNAVVHQYRYGGSPLSRDDFWLTIAFPFTAYTLVCSHHIPLCIGMKCGLCFDLAPDKVGAMLLKGRYNHMAYTPMTYEKMIQDEMIQKSELPFLKNPTVGADTLQAESEEVINEFLRDHKASGKIVKGYGMTEVCAAVCVCTQEVNKVGSVGIPFMNTVISIFDLKTGEELMYHQQGEICISGPSVMPEYFHNPKETAKVLRRHPDGRIWMHSGDLGYMDEDGFLFVAGRLKRMLIVHTGFKIFAPQVEQVISTCEDVEKCCVVGAPDTVHCSGQVAVAYMILKPGKMPNEKKLQEICGQALPEYAVPQRFEFVDSFPYTGVGKVDYRALEERAKTQS